MASRSIHFLALDWNYTEAVGDVNTLELIKNGLKTCRYSHYTFLNVVRK
jgi:hypothetical protein